MIHGAHQHILLVGGYGESLHLRQEVKQSFESAVCQITALDDGTYVGSDFGANSRCICSTCEVEHPSIYRAKAVSDGAVIWRCMQKVEGRRARFTFGAGISYVYDPKDKKQKGRTIYDSPSGYRYVRDYWNQIVTKVRNVRSKPFFYHLTQLVKSVANITN